MTEPLHIPLSTDPTPQNTNPDSDSDQTFTGRTSSKRLSNRIIKQLLAQGSPASGRGSVFKPRNSIFHAIPTLIKRENVFMGNATFNVFIEPDVYRRDYEETPLNKKVIPFKRGDTLNRPQNQNQSFEPFKKKKETGKMFINELWSKRHYHNIASKSLIKDQSEEIHKLHLQTTEEKVQIATDYLYAKGSVKRDVMESLFAKHQRGQKISTEDLELYPGLGYMNNTSGVQSRNNISESQILMKSPSKRRALPLRQISKMELCDSQVLSSDHSDSMNTRSEGHKRKKIQFIPLSSKKQSDSTVATSSFSMRGRVSPNHDLQKNMSWFGIASEKKQLESSQVLKTEEDVRPVLPKLNILTKQNSAKRFEFKDGSLSSKLPDSGTRLPFNAKSPTTRENGSKLLKNFKTMNSSKLGKNMSPQGNMVDSLSNLDTQKSTDHVIGSFTRLIENCDEFSNDKAALKKVNQFSIEVSDSGRLKMKTEIRKRRENIKKKTFIDKYRSIKSIQEIDRK